MTEIIQSRSDRPIRLQNLSCPYCRRTLDASVPSNKEHVVGRNFVPKGKMENQPQLIFIACRKCNSEKSQLEDDISVISMIPGGTSRGAEIDEVLAGEFKRRAHKSGSRRTGRPVATSHEELLVQSRWGPATFTFRMAAPPQADSDRVYRLAQFHFDAFFYWLHFNGESRRGGFFPSGAYYNVGIFIRGNWGDAKARWFMNATAEWPLGVAITTANGYFRLIIRQSPCKRIWACAVEWNHSIRVKKLHGDPEALQTFLETIPDAEEDWVEDDQGNPVKMTVQRELDPEEDRLFVVTMPAPESQPPEVPQ